LQGQPQGQMISGYYVKPSITQALNPVVQQLAGSYLGKQADIKTQELANAIRQAKGAKEEAITNLITGTPEKTTELAGPYTSNIPMPTAYQAARGPDLSGALKEIATNNPYGAGSEYKAAIIGNMIPKTPDKILEYKQAVQDGFKGTYNDWANQMTPYQKEELRLKNIEVSNSAKNAAINPQENQLRTSFLNQAQPHIQISQAYRKIVSAPETAAGDMSRIFGYMKILDPGSTVREGEYASAENARGVPASVMAQYNRVLNGQRLTPQQRNEFTQSAGDLVNSQKQQFADVAKYYGDISGRYGVNPQNIIYDPYQGLELKTTPPKAPKAPANVNEQLSIPSAGGWSVKAVQ
jgi:hypothetical protein